MESIIAAAITGILTLVGVIVANSRNQAVLEVKIDELSKRVDKHNEVLERTYALERDMAVVKSELKGTGRE
jgi:Tfp pilus assembly protein PilE